MHGLNNSLICTDLNNIPPEVTSVPPVPPSSLPPPSQDIPPPSPPADLHARTVCAAPPSDGSGNAWINKVTILQEV